MKTSALIFMAGLAIGPAASAGGWWTPTEIRRFCNKLLTPVLKQRSPAPLAISEDYRSRFNDISLQSTRALLMFEPNRWVKVVDTEQLDVLSWLDSVTRRAINVVLDSQLPHWRQDQVWYFQTTTATALYSPKSVEPIEFEAGSFILMMKQYAIGQIYLANRPYLDLFE